LLASSSIADGDMSGVPVIFWRSSSVVTVRCPIDREHDRDDPEGDQDGSGDNPTHAKHSISSHGQPPFRKRGYASRSSRGGGSTLREIALAAIVLSG
jgi:hypothetical protein